MLQISIQTTTQQLVATWDKRINQCTTIKTVSECSLNEETLKPRHFDPIQKGKQAQFNITPLGLALVWSRVRGVPMPPCSHLNPMIRLLHSLALGGAVRTYGFWVSFWGSRCRSGVLWLRPGVGCYASLPPPQPFLVAKKKRTPQHNTI